ncbi:MAG TPA: hypothetical protein VD978_24835 [Azospirillum sp.]|nr:hypothetical protein [Azospirillum sp.]
MPSLDWLIRTVFAIASVVLMLLAGALITYAGVQVFTVVRQTEANVGSTLLEAVGYTIIAIAVFDVGKYILEEETIRSRELRHADEARRSLTKLISTISTAVFLEALVAVFEASKENMTMMLYPTLLLFGGIAMVIGLGVYQRLSTSVEREIGGAKGEDEADTAQQASSTKRA